MSRRFFGKKQKFTPQRKSDSLMHEANKLIDIFDDLISNIGTMKGEENSTLFYRTQIDNYKKRKFREERLNAAS